MLEKKQIIMIAGAALVVVIVIVAIVMAVKSGKVTTNNQGTTGNTPTIDMGANFQESATKAAVPVDAKVPELNEKPTSAEVAVPVSVTEAAKGVEAKLRTYKISATGGKFSPSEIIANQGDTVHVDFTAVDKTYDMTFPDYGMKQVANAGQTKIFEFQAVNPGKYVYYCESCGGLNSTAKGYFTIVPKK